VGSCLALGFRGCGGALSPPSGIVGSAELELEIDHLALESARAMLMPARLVLLARRREGT
jgi:hypothetical protein